MGQALNLRHLLTVVCTFTLAFCASVTTGLPSQADEQSSALKVHRVTGADHISVASTAARSYSSGQAVTFVVNADAHADAMVAAARAGGIDAPIVLVTTNSIPSVTREALSHLAPRRIVVVGGESVVSDAVQDELGSYARGGTVERISGVDRYATAADLAMSFNPGAPVVYLAGGAGFPDAMAGTALASSRNAPIALTPGDRLHASTRNALKHLRPSQVVVLGGPRAVSAGVAAEAASYSTSGKVQRLSGPDRYATASKIAAHFSDATPTAYVASGATYAEALVAAAMAGREHAPLLLVRPESIPKATHTALDRFSLRNIHAVGTRAAISDPVVRDLGRGTRRSSITQALTDTWGPHDHIPRGVPAGYSWREQSTATPTGSTSFKDYGAINQWGQIFVAEGADPNTNLRVQVRSPRVWWWVGGNRYVEAENTPGRHGGAFFRGDYNQTQTLPGGARDDGADGWSVPLNRLDGQGVDSWHWWWEGQYPRLPRPANAKGIVSYIDIRLIPADGRSSLGNTEGLIANIGVDLFATPKTVVGGPNGNPGIPQPRMKQVTGNWQRIWITTLSEEQIRKHPPTSVLD